MWLLEEMTKGGREENGKEGRERRRKGLREGEGREAAQSSSEGLWQGGEGNRAGMGGRRDGKVPTAVMQLQVSARQQTDS